MAGLIRSRNILKLVSRLSSVPNIQIQPSQRTLHFCRSMSTTAKKCEETLFTDEDPREREPPGKPKKYWVSYGYSYTSEAVDRQRMHVAFFITITLTLGFVSWFLMYKPDFKGRDWAFREAHLELRRREQLGLLPIDPNYIDPAKIILPPDEELSDDEIII